jgi:hypothetical protein
LPLLLHQLFIESFKFQEHIPDACPELVHIELEFYHIVLHPLRFIFLDVESALGTAFAAFSFLVSAVGGMVFGNH